MSASYTIPKLTFHVRVTEWGVVSSVFDHNAPEPIKLHRMPYSIPDS